MDMTFSASPIGRVRRIELAPDGAARIVIDVPVRDAKWLRESSVFTLSRSLVGGAALKAYSGVLSDPPLADGAERRAGGDATAELPRPVSDARELIGNLTRLTAADSPLAASPGNVQTITGRGTGARRLRHGAGRGRREADRRGAAACQQPGAHRRHGRQGRCAGAGPQGLVNESPGGVAASSTPCSAMRARPEEGRCTARRGPAWRATCVAPPTISTRCAARSTPRCARSSSWSTRSTASGPSSATRSRSSK